MAKRPALPNLQLRSQLEHARKELYKGAESKFDLLFYFHEEKRELTGALGLAFAPHWVQHTNIPKEAMPATFELQLREYSARLFDTEAGIRFEIAINEAVLLEWLQDLAADIRIEVGARISGQRFDFHFDKENRARTVAESLDERIKFWYERKAHQKQPKATVSASPSHKLIEAVVLNHAGDSQKTAETRNEKAQRTHRDPDLSLLEKKKSLNRREAAAALGITERTLDRWVEEGKITPLRIGHKNSYPAATLRSLIALATDNKRLE